jgi:hypothetical protein
VVGHPSEQPNVTLESEGEWPNKRQIFTQPVLTSLHSDLPNAGQIFTLL